MEEACESFTLFMIRFWKGGPIQVTFQPDNLGLSFSRNVITRVIPQTQADISGIRCGWVILSVNGISQPENHFHIANSIRANQSIGKPSVLLFREVSSRPTALS